MLILPFKLNNHNFKFIVVMRNWLSIIFLLLHIFTHWLVHKFYSKKNWKLYGLIMNEWQSEWMNKWTEYMNCNCIWFYSIWFSNMIFLNYKLKTDRKTEGRMDGQMDGYMKGQTDQLIWHYKEFYLFSLLYFISFFLFL